MLRRFLNALKGTKRVQGANPSNLDDMTIPELARYKPRSAFEAAQLAERILRMSEAECEEFNAIARQGSGESGDVRAKNEPAADATRARGVEDAKRMVEDGYARAIQIGRDDPDTGIGKLTEVLSVALTLEDPAYSAVVTKALTQFLVHQGRAADAEARLLEVQQHCARQGSQFYVASLKEDRAVLVRDRGETAEAYQLLREALETLEAEEKSAIDAKSASYLSMIRERKARVVWEMTPDEAAADGFDRFGLYSRYVEEWIAASRQSGDPRQLANALMTAGLDPGCFERERKRAQLEEALAVSVRFGLADEEQRIRGVLGVMRSAGIDL